jgi:putative oxidoreductase
MERDKMIDIRTAPYAALLLRLTLGVALLAHGLMKVFVFTLPGTVGFFQSLGLPGFLAYLVVLVEVVAGLALILGFRTRIAALIAVPVLLGAAWVHAPNGLVFSNPNGGWEFPVFWAAALLVQSLLGDGAYAISRSSQPALKAA